MMQSIFRLPWCSEPVAPKMADAVVLEKMRPTPVVEIPVLSKLKRKRTDSASDDAGIPRGQQEKKPRATNVGMMSGQPSPDPRLPSKAEALQQTSVTTSANTSPNPDSGHNATLHFDSTLSPSLPCESLLSSTSNNVTTDTMAGADLPSVRDASLLTAEESRSRLQDVIENEFNMQILLKHNELRLIEQELAKCQVAMEQLRRIELRPFPGTERPLEAISMGTGASVLPSPDFTKPACPAPYGVTDGPYTRHYSQWLLQDPLFDSVPMSSDFFADSMAQMAGRSTRNSGSSRKSISKPFTFPARGTESLQSIPNYPAPVKDKSAPLILKRSTDNQFVKLICNNCLRGNFSSIQGFLNHCRIAHKVDYKSHDAAAIDCGRVLEDHEAVHLPAEPVTHTPAHKPSLSRISTAASTPYRNLVHPLNTTVGASVPPSNGSKVASAARAAVPSLATGSASSTEPSFVPSTQLPRLSAQFAKYNFGGDLAAAVAQAKQAVDLGFNDDPASPDTPDRHSPLDTPNPRSANGKSGMKVPQGRKGVRQMQRQTRPLPITPAQYPTHHHDNESPESPHYPSSTATFSPHTADSNPGLVSDHSDHEDDDQGLVSEDEEAPHHHEGPAMPRHFSVNDRSCADNIVIEDATEDDERVGNGGLIIRRNGLYAHEEVRGVGGGSKSRKLAVAKRGA